MIETNVCKPSSGMKMVSGRRLWQAYSQLASGFRDHLDPSRFTKHLEIAFGQSEFCAQENWL